MPRLLKFWSLTAHEKNLLFEASILLCLCNACRKFIPFTHIDRFLRARWDKGSQGDIDRKEDIRLVQRSISRAANSLPWKSLCLSRSLAEFVMLRRRGIPSVIFMGVRFSDDASLEAHAWVEAGLENTRKSDSAFTIVHWIQ